MKKIDEQENLKTYAQIIDGKVVNVSVWNGESNWTPDEELIEIPKGVFAGIGFDYDGKNFIDNRPQEPIEP